MSDESFNDRENGWREYRRLILSEIGRAIMGVERLEEKLEKKTDGLREQILNLKGELNKQNLLYEKRFESIERDIAISKAKAGIIGGIAGLVIGFVPTIISWLTNIGG